MGTRAALRTYPLVVCLAGLTLVACNYDNGGVSAPVDLARDAGGPPPRDARGSGTAPPATDASSGVTSVKPVDAAGNDAAADHPRR